MPIDLATAIKSKTMALPLRIDWRAGGGLKRIDLQAQKESPPSGEREGLIPYDFRILSAAYLPDNFIDYSNQDVLKAAVEQKLAESVTVKTDHDYSVQNWIGITGRAWWENQKGDAPAGINAVLWLDIEQSNASGNLIRGLDIGAVHSASVAVKFNWKKSHPDMSDNEFINKLGEKINGEYVRIICTKIVQFMEVSLVWQGADPDAKIKNDETKSVITGQQSAGGIYGGNDMIKRLSTILGVPESEITEEKLPALIQDLAKSEAGKLQASLVEENKTLKAKETEREEKITTLEAQVSGSALLVEAGKKYTAELTAEVKRLFAIATGKAPGGEMDKQISERTSIEQLEGLKGLYAPLAEKKAGALKCQDCGSTNISRQQTQTPTPDNKDKQNAGEGALLKAQKEYVKTYFPVEE